MFKAASRSVNLPALSGRATALPPPLCCSVREGRHSVRCAGQRSGGSNQRLGHRGGGWAHGQGWAEVSGEWVLLGSLLKGRCLAYCLSLAVLMLCRSRLQSLALRQGLLSLLEFVSPLCLTAPVLPSQCVHRRQLMSLSFAGMGLSMLAMAAGLSLPFLSGALPRAAPEGPPCAVHSCWAACNVPLGCLGCVQCLTGLRGLPCLFCWCTRAALPTWSTCKSTCLGTPSGNNAAVDCFGSATAHRSRQSHRHDGRNRPGWHPCLHPVFCTGRRPCARPAGAGNHGCTHPRCVCAVHSLLLMRGCAVRSAGFPDASERPRRASTLAMRTWHAMQQHRARCAVACQLARSHSSSHPLPPPPQAVRCRWQWSPTGASSRPLLEAQHTRMLHAVLMCCPAAANHTPSVLPRVRWLLLQPGHALVLLPQIGRVFPQLPSNAPTHPPLLPRPTSSPQGLQLCHRPAVPIGSGRLWRAGCVPVLCRRLLRLRGVGGAGSGGDERAQPGGD